MWSFFREFWQALRDLRRSAGALRRVESRLRVVEQQLEDQRATLMRIARQQNTLLATVQPTVRNI